MIGRIVRRPLREVWKHEALDFTRWLVDNIEVLSEAIDVPLQDPKREQAAGNFSVDLVAEDGSGNTVVIENQLEKSNHDHLGKIITYLASLVARVAIWIVSEPRPEHTQAITWLNESRQASFYLVKAEAISIESPSQQWPPPSNVSAPACLLTLITGPSEETHEVGAIKQEFADRYTIRRHFWETLLDRARQKTRLYSTLSPTNDNWISVTSGRPGLSFQTTITQHEATVQLVIDRGRDSAAENQTILNRLKEHRAQIEGEFGAPLEWYEPERVRLRRVIHKIKAGGYRMKRQNGLRYTMLLSTRWCGSRKRSDRSSQPFNRWPKWKVRAFDQNEEPRSVMHGFGARTLSAQCAGYHAPVCRYVARTRRCQ